MGREILNNLETHDNANIPVGEGVVIRGMRPTPRSKNFYLPFKIAGDFILQGLQSPFQQPA